MNKPLVAVVLAGGAGRRFWPLTQDKICFPFLGKPFFEYSINESLPEEVSKVVLIANSVNKQIFDSLQLSKPHVTVLQNQPLGMADAILSAKSEIGNSRLLVMIADDIFDKNLYRRVIELSTKEQVFGIVPGWKTPTYFPGGYLILRDNVVIGIKEKPNEGDEPSPYVYISGQYIDDSDVLLDTLKKTTSDVDDIYEKALTKLMKKERFMMLPYEGNFASLKYPWNVLDVMNILLHSRLQPYRGKNIQIKSNVVIEGDVYLGDDVKIFENCKITGPTYIGNGTIIGNNSIIRASHIGDHCVTGFNTDITRSYIGDSCWFHTNFIGDSVLEKDISFGSGTVTANLRLDEQEIGSMVKDKKISTRRNKVGVVVGQRVKAGVNVSFMPGIKIGSDSMIGAGIILQRDIPDHSFVYKKQELVLEVNTASTVSDRSKFRSLL